ncbi:MAG: hypothetical protein ACI4R8_04500 [Candidatus Caccovivens sp.]
MKLSRGAKKYMIMGIFLSILAISFALLYYFNLIKRLDLFLAVTYITYFVGLALMYNGAYNRTFIRNKATVINFILGILFILGSIALLIYGLITGVIVIF